ncbi:MAG: 3-deoxy-manno-octulosonate cytidylyltransferase [Ignavibacteriales bacterium]|nr:3-deoxy-manno-octulosonate cytidylyltransferase [Ignavibacteriales bacterium]
MIIGIIPARYASTRLPGKPLVEIDGLPMVIRTYRSALTSKFLHRVIVATDDEKIYTVCKEYHVDVMMTGKEFKTGSDRIASAVQSIFNADIIVNIQGDEPFIPGKMIDQAIEPMLMDPDVMVSTLAKKIDDVRQLLSPAVVKVVFDMNNYALYFSRSVIPYAREYSDIAAAIKSISYYKHVGLYVYKREALTKFTSLPQSELERIECLEQLRMLEHGMKIKVVETEYESLSVDTPDDVIAANRYSAKLQNR